MSGCNLGAAQFTALHIAFAPDKLAQRPEGGFVLRLNCAGRHRFAL
jgi:hypothetical protein